MLLEKDYRGSIRSAVRALVKHGYRPAPAGQYVTWQDADGLPAFLLDYGHYVKIECEVPDGYYSQPGGVDLRPNKGMFPDGSDYRSGDRIQHAQCPSWKGTFLRYSKPYDLGGSRGMRRQVWWRYNDAPPGHEPCWKVDYTWEDVIERQIDVGA